MYLCFLLFSYLRLPGTLPHVSNVITPADRSIGPFLGAKFGFDFQPLARQLFVLT